MDNISTERVIVRMLKEDTGIHFMDSGGESDRHWQRNQLRHFQKEEGVSLSFRHGYIRVTRNIFHFLKDTLTYSSKLDKVFDKFCKKTDPSNRECWLQLMEDFIDKLKSSDFLVGTSFTDNSYNNENIISQTIQYSYFKTNEFRMYGIDVPANTYVLLQIHNGADVRGGYTKPRAFFSRYDHSILRYAYANIVCSNENHKHSWNTDDGVHWYFSGNGARDVDKTDLDGYDVACITDEKDWKKGMLCINEEQDIGYCPICGGVLTAYC